jgi:tRNA A-37 threonylcarbamoyl transferase component Bud32
MNGYADVLGPETARETLQKIEAIERRGRYVEEREM